MILAHFMNWNYQVAQSNFEFEKGVECITVTPDFYGRVDFAWFLFFSGFSLPKMVRNIVFSSVRN